MNRLKEVAKFASGAEAFHAIVHVFFWSTGVTLTVFGIKETPAMHLVGAIVNALISLVLGLYAWEWPRRGRSA